MKIAVVSKADARGGGASKVAVDLSAGMLEAGHEVLHMVSTSSKGFDHVMVPAYGKSDRGIRKLHTLARRAGAGELLGIDTSAVMSVLGGFKPDIVHFHDTSGCFSVPLLRRVAERYRTFWTFHDCSPFTGGCLYDIGCAQLSRGCGGCPRIGEWPIDGFIDMTARRYAAKHELLGRGAMRIIAPSDWMADHAVNAGKLAVRPTVISNGVNVGVFDRNGSDTTFSRDGPMKIILSAGSLADTRKGIRQAAAVVRAVNKVTPCEVYLIGKPDSAIDKELADVRREALGFVSGEEAMARALGKADVFLLCSLADNQPLAVLEALSMGMVIGAYAAGGVAGMIKDSINGLLAAPGDPEALARKLVDAHAAGMFPVLQAAARSTAVQQHSMSLFVAKHEAAYTESM
jgi:glycosyltransferase involved in cell wall biosynthesis